MSRFRKLIYAITILAIFYAFIIPIASQNSSADDKEEKFFYNPLPRQMLTRTEEAIKETSFVLENYFICDGIDDAKYIQTKHKIKIEGELLIYIQSTLLSLKDDIKDHESFLEKFKDLAPINTKKRMETFGYGVNRIENNRAVIEEVLCGIFKPVLEFDFSDYDNNLRDPNEDTYINYLFDLRNRLRYIKNILMKTYAISNMYYTGETVLKIFETRKFVLEGNINSDMNITPFVTLAKTAKTFHLLKMNGTPFTDEEMASLTPADFRNADQDNPPKVKWSPLSFNGLDFIGMTFRDSPDFESPNKFEEIVEFYFLGQINIPIEEIMFNEVMNEAPIEIRWIDGDGKRHIIWNPYGVYPLNFVPPASNSLYDTNSFEEVKKMPFTL